MYDITIFGIHLSLNPVAFTIPGIGWKVYWYGIIITVGAFLAVIYAYRNAKRFGLDFDRMLDVVLVAVPCAILGARTYYLVFDGVKGNLFSDFFGSGGSGFSGLAIYGGVIGAFVSGSIMCKIRKVPLLDMFDIAAIGFLIGQGIGRWGNFFNQEAYGTFTGSAFWGMTSNKIVSEVGQGLVHPCFLYESIWCLLGAFLLHKLSKNRKFSGQLILTYCVWYGFGRALIEPMRTDSLMIGSVRVSFLLSLLLCVAAAVALVLILRKRRTEKTYVSMFDDPVEETEADTEIND